MRQPTIALVATSSLLATPLALAQDGDAAKAPTAAKGDASRILWIARSERIRASNPLLPKSLLCITDPSKTFENRHFLQKDT